MHVNDKHRAASILSLEFHPQLTAFDPRLKNLRLECGLAFRFSRLEIEGVGVPWANHAPVFDRSFSQRSAFVRTDAIQHADASFKVGDAKRAPIHRELAQVSRLGQFGLGTDAYEFDHDDSFPAYASVFFSIYLIMVTAI
jgi:hypothetical protein